MSQGLWIRSHDGNIEGVKRCLKDKTLDVDRKCSNGVTALHSASSSSGHGDIVELSLDHGANI